MLAAIWTVLPSLAFVVVYLVGIVLAFTWRMHHPMVSLWAGLGFGALLLATVLGVGSQLYIVYMSGQGGRVSEIGLLVGAVSLLSTAIRIFGAVALMVAVFGWRRHDPAPPTQAV